MSWFCPCELEYPDRISTCEFCGTPRPPAASPHSQPRPCPLDGAILHANSFCPSGQGFPISLHTCPDRCPHCHHALQWDGDCRSCLPPHEKPGHRYDFAPYSPLDPQSAHWRVVAYGPQPIAPTSPTDRAFLNVKTLEIPL